MVELTKSQKEILDKIKLFISKNGYAPTVRELCFLTDRNSPATIHFHLKHLKEKGYIDFDYNKNRTVKLINDNKDKVINDLLKRISNVEYETEKLNNIIEKLEKHLLKTYEEWKDTETNYDIAMESMYIYNYIQQLKKENK